MRVANVVENAAVYLPEQFTIALEQVYVQVAGAFFG